MYELKRTEQVDRLIEITKSNSGISGPLLAQAHIELGMLLAKEMDYPAEETTVVAVLRGGIFFAQGIYFGLGCKFQIYDPKSENFVRPTTKHVILVDSVINSGKTVMHIAAPDVDIACCVINEKAVPLIRNRLFTVRVSQNAFTGADIKKQNGSVGPDTT